MMGLLTPKRKDVASVAPQPMAAAQPALQGGPPPAQHPQGQQQQQGVSKDPYEAIKVPKLPDLTNFPVELQVFREQCAGGVRQAVAMVTAMEQQLWWERSRRMQAEEDVKVLLAAIEAERVLAGGALQDVNGMLAEAQAEARGEKLTLRADQLPDASKAATTIQKHFRGHAARKDFENHLKDVLRGVDPELDPSMLPEGAQHHVSDVNRRGGGRGGGGGQGVRATMQGMKLSNPLIIPGDALTQQMRHEVDQIQRRIDGLPDAGFTPDAADASLDVKKILQGSLPASSAQVIAALVRRCKELQTALVEACESLQQSRLAEQGLRAQNMKLLELSKVRMDLQEERDGRQALQQSVNKLRHALLHQAGTAQTAKQSPHVAAWYRRTYADGDFIKWEPGKRVFDGAEAEVELWDDLRPGLPEPMLIPTKDTQQYADLLALHQHMAHAGVEQLGFPNPLYNMETPDASHFSYARDTPIVPIATPLNLIRESGQVNGGAGYEGLPGLFDPTREQVRGPDGTPIVPMYSVLPLIRESGYMAKQPDTSPSFSFPQPPPHVPPPMPNLPPMARPDGKEFNYVRDTPRITVLTPLPLMQGSAGGAPPRPTSQGGAGATYQQLTPQMEMISPLPLIRESAAPQQTFLPQTPPAAAISPLALIREGGAAAVPAGGVAPPPSAFAPPPDYTRPQPAPPQDAPPPAPFDYLRDTPQLPMRSPLPLIREGHARAATGAAQPARPSRPYWMGGAGEPQGGYSTPASDAFTFASPAGGQQWQGADGGALPQVNVITNLPLIHESWQVSRTGEVTQLPAAKQQAPGDAYPQQRWA